MKKYYLTFNDVIKSPLFSVWATALILFTLCRKLLQTIYSHKTLGTHKNTPSGSIFFETIGLMFGTTGLWSNLVNKPEKILILFLSLCGMIASIFCTGMLFDQFAMDLSRPNINCLEDLAKNESIEIYVTKEFEDDKLGLRKM